MENKEKLKTLKEIELEYRDSISVDTELLRAEAVKWVKELMELNKAFPISLDDGGDIRWIKHFFNLTDEDLK